MAHSVLAILQGHLYASEHEYILAGDEIVVTKAGKKTHGLDRFFSSLWSKGRLRPIVASAIQLSLFTVDVSQYLLPAFRGELPQAGVLDLKTHFRGESYASETLKLLPQKPEPILFQRITRVVARLGGVHNQPPRARVA